MENNSDAGIVESDDVVQGQEQVLGQSEGQEQGSENVASSSSGDAIQPVVQRAAKPFADQSSPRKPGALPAGASLAERIAALQKSSGAAGPQRSSNGRTGDRSVSSFVGSADKASSAAAAAASSRDAQQNRSVSSGSRLPPNLSGSAAVRDRIAKFQGTEKPLLPKSSFGSPSPMGAERNSNVLRPYPGANATGGGSGAWGEGVLRPQVTGGTWVGAGEGRGWQSIDSNSIRPQLTGTPWTGAGTSSPSFGRYKANSTSSNGSIPRSPMRSRDAFLDLDEDSSLLSVSPQKSRPGARRESSFSEAQLAAASMGLSRSPKPQTGDDKAESVEDQASSVAESREGNETLSTATTLADLPEAPTDQPSKRSESTSQLNSLPDPPTTAPFIRSPEMNQSILSNDVEISIGNATPEKMEKLRRTASGTYDDSFVEGVKSDERTIQNRSALLTDIEARKRSLETHVAPNRGLSAADDDGASDIGRLIISSSATDDGSAIDSPAAGVQPLPGVGEESIEPEEESKAPVSTESPLDPAIAQTMATQTVQHENTPDISRHGRTTSNESGIIDPLTLRPAESNIVASSSSTTTQLPPSVPADSSDVLHDEYDDQRTADVSMIMSQSEGLNELQNTSAQAAQQAKQAISAARSKSQKVKKPPPGRMMTAAEMDASDDEYEPGWASVTTVFSSSRQSM